MRGTEVTPKQFEAAQKFIMDRNHGQRSLPAEDESIHLEWGNFVRMVAWYGALRYQAGRDGINSLDDPGICD